MKTCVACFSGQDNLLTQWKTYGVWGAGFSIGFDRSRLQELINPKVTIAELMKLSSFSKPDVRLAKVRYREDEQRNSLLMFMRYSRLLNDRSVAHEIDRCASAIGDNVAITAAAFKHPCFEAEDEWRIIVSTIAFGRFPVDNDAALSFRESSRTVIPYLKIPPQAGPRLPIVSVTIGPTLDQRLSELSVRALLRAKGYDNVQVKTSGLPLTRTD